MPAYEYYCDKCKVRRFTDKTIDKCENKEICHCGNEMHKDYSGIGITGTRDNFGVNKSFVNESTGQVIDNWKSWERAGYKSAIDHCKPELKEMVKRKVEKIKRYDNGNRKSIVF